MARVLVAVTLLLCGCTHRAAPPAEVRPAPGSLAPRAAAAAKTPAIELSAAPAVEPVQLSILEPAPGQTLALADAAKTAVSVHSARPDWVVELALDGRRARPLTTLPEKPALGDLTESGALEAGEHYLVAALRAAENEPARFAIARFSVEIKAATREEPIVYCGRPSGTYYGPGGTSLLLDFAIDGFQPGTDGAVLVRAVRADAPGTLREARLLDGRARLVHGITAGDWSIELSLIGPEQQPLKGQLARHRCQLTLNEVSSP